MDKATVIFSGGMDSSALLFMLMDQYSEVHALSFDYGQRHRKELTAAKALIRHLEALPTGAYVSHDVISLKGVTQYLAGSALTDDVEVPEGLYDEENMKSTVVPNRNMMMLSVATAVAVAERSNAVYTGVHSGDHAVYPDCRPEFLHAVNLAAQAGNDGFAARGFRIEAPFIHMEKSEIAKVGDRHNVPWAKTWSCYKGGAHHCGRCGTCVERQEAFWLAKVDDATKYDDSDYWKSVSKVYPKFTFKVDKITVVELPHG